MKTKPTVTSTIIRQMEDSSADHFQALNDLKSFCRVVKKKLPAAEFNLLRAAAAVIKMNIYAKWDADRAQRPGDN